MKYKGKEYTNEQLEEMIDIYEYGYLRQCVKDEAYGYYEGLTDKDLDEVLSEEKLEQVVDYVMNDDQLWQELSSSMCYALTHIGGVEHE